VVRLRVDAIERHGNDGAVSPGRPKPAARDDQSTRRPRPRRLTAYFALLVALAAMAAGAAVAYVSVQTDRDSRRAAEADAAFAAAAAATELDEGLTLVRQTVASLASLPGLPQSAERPSCSLASGASSRGLRSHLVVLRPDGSVACSSSPRATAGYQGASWLAPAQEAPVLRAPANDAVGGGSSVVAAAPAPRGWVVAAFVPLASIGAALASPDGSRRIELLVVTGDGQTVLTRSIGPSRWVGRPLAGTAFAQAAGRVERRDLDGTARLYAAAPVASAGWQIYAGVDKRTALAAGNRLRDRELAIVAAGFGLVLLAAFVVYRRVAVPLRRLAQAVRRTATLMPPEPVPVSGPTQIVELGDNVNSLIDSVRREMREREQAEKRTLASERSYQAMFVSSPLPMWIYDAQTLAIVAVNDAAIARYGYPREEFLSLTMPDLVLRHGREGAFAGEPVPGLARHRRKDGSEIKVQTVAHAVRLDGRDRYCVVAEDVGERERLESQLRQAQKMEAVGHLAGGIAHDFNNILTVISGYGGMARERIGAGPGGRELAEIERATDRAARLTHQLLAFSRRQVLDPVVLDLNEVVTSVVPMVAQLIGENIEIGVLADESAPPVLADRGQVEQVIVNLAVNARDAMPGGGTLTIETGQEVLDERYADAHPGVEPGEYALLAVTDTGVGMDRETQSHVFEPFFTTKEVGSGTGLGLATVHGIVSQSGGHVEVYSEPDLGSTFKIYLPASLDAAAATPAREPAAEPAQLGGTETILLCEDDELVRDLVATVLTAGGYRVLVTDRPEEAISVATSHDGRIDAIVSDTVMPQLSGPELVEQLEHLRPGLRSLLLSGYRAETLCNRGLEGGSAFLQKPFNDASLLHAVRALLDGRLGGATHWHSPLPGVERS
jgi:two-component system cell cycle sensor histidine kinase/response regulator CckA